MFKIGLIGCGAIGSVLAKAIDKDKDFKLCWFYDLKKEKAVSLAKKLHRKPKIATSLKDMLDCDLIIEAASQEAAKQYALKILDHCDFMIMSVGALGDKGLFDQIKNKAKRNNRKVYLPSGAICGLDGVKAANIEEIKEVTLTTRKPPQGLEEAPYLIKNKIDLSDLSKPIIIFEGNAKEAARWFPKNINVSVALALAGIGVEKTKVRIIADPFTKRNIHEIVVEGKFGKLQTRTENLPCPANPKTSYLAALSAIKILKKIKENIIIGT